MLEVTARSQGLAAPPECARTVRGENNRKERARIENKHNSAVRESTSAAQGPNFGVQTPARGAASVDGRQVGHLRVVYQLRGGMALRLVVG